MKIAVHDFVGHPFVFELSSELARSGHDVRHFYFGAYPGPQGYCEDFEANGGQLKICKLSIDRPYSTEHLRTRLTGNLSYGAKLYKSLIDFNPDLVISGNAPTEVQEFVQRACRKADAKFVYWMQDIYSLAVSSLIGKRWWGVGALIGKLYRYLDGRHFRKSDGIILISESFRQELQKFGKISCPVWVIQNWGSIGDIVVKPKKNAWSIRQGVSDRFVYLYSGTLGLKHDPMLLVELARALEGQSDAILIVAARGAGRTLLEQKLAQNPQSNLKLLDLQPIEDLADMLGSADVLLALLESDAGKFSVPSKVLSYLCAGRAVVLSAPPGNLSTQIVVESGAGLAVPAGRPEAFVAAAIEMQNRSVADEAGRRGRAYAEANFKIEAISAKFQGIFHSLIHGKIESE